MSTSADERFEQVAEAAIDDLLERHPEVATALGDHRFDDRLSDPSASALDDERRAVSGFLTRLGEIEGDGLSGPNRIDVQILRSRLEERLFELDELREHEWNPLLGNPA